MNKTQYTSKKMFTTNEGNIHYNLNKMQALNQTTVTKKTYTERIIQFGEGNFLRAFVDWIVQQMNDKVEFDSSIVVVQPIKEGMVSALKKQDCLYHVNLQGINKGETVNSFKRIDAISRAINPYEETDAFMRLAEQDSIRFVVSNTTEAGIHFDPKCQRDDKPASSYPGKLTQLLYHRFTHYQGDPTKGLIIFPCELIFHNGRKLKECVLQYIDLWQLGEAFKEWFCNCCGIYSTLVDRIVPGFPRKDIAGIQEQLGFADNLLVQGEIFHLWVIEAPQEVAAEFPADKANLNVLFVSNEDPYHKRKVTLLNGPHTVLSPVSFFSGIDLVRDACKDRLIGEYIHKVMYKELMPTIDLPQQELMQFAGDVMERFLNPYVDHQVTSIMLNSFSKYKARVLPGLLTFKEETGELPEGLVLGLAAIILYYKGGKRGEDIICPQEDEQTLKLLSDSWESGNADKVASNILGCQSLWDRDLNSVDGLTDQLAFFLKAIQERGMLETVKQIL